MPRRVSVEEMDESTLLLPAGEPQEIPGDVSEQWEEFEKFRDQEDAANKGMTVWVYRIPTDARGNPESNMDTRLLFTAPIDLYSLPQLYDRIKKEYMPRGYGVGIFRVMIRQNNVKGVKWQKVVTLEKGAKDDEPEAKPDNSGTSIAAVAQLFQKTLDDAMRANRELIGQLLTRQNVAPPDPFGGAQQIVAMVTGLAGVLMKPAAGAGGGIAEQVSGIREILKLSNDLGALRGGGGDDAGGDGNSISSILQAAAPYANLLKDLLARAPAPAAPVHRLPPPPMRAEPARAPNPQTVTAPQAQGNDPMLLQLAKHVSDICDLIAQGKAEPEGVALLILDAVPAEYDDRFYEIVAADNWLTKLAAIEPRVRQHTEFFTAVRARIMQEFAEDSEAVPGNPAAPV